MPKGANPSRSVKVRITLSEQSVSLLEVLATKGIYGRSSAEVAGRFVDEALHRLVEPPRLRLPSRPRKQRR